MRSQVKQEEHLKDTAIRDKEDALKREMTTRAALEKAQEEAVQLRAQKHTDAEQLVQAKRTIEELNHKVATLDKATARRETTAPDDPTITDVKRENDRLHYEIKLLKTAIGTHKATILDSLSNLESAEVKPSIEATPTPAPPTPVPTGMAGTPILANLRKKR